MTRQRRHRKLVKPKLQLKLVGTFLGLVFVGFLLQSLLLHAELQRVSGALPGGGEELAALLPGLQSRVLILSMLVLLPATLVIGILTTHRIAGPVHRLETYLREIEEGQANSICRLRRRDELKELCSQLNRTLTTIEARGGRVWPAEEFSAPPRSTKKAAHEELSHAA